MSFWHERWCLFVTTRKVITSKIQLKKMLFQSLEKLFRGENTCAKKTQVERKCRIFNRVLSKPSFIRSTLSLTKN
uniref:Candidate secreted effector n=1 Tax=Meloidogyne incognita TaxID=6306 RepID=A0A914L4K1_MELIC